MMKMCETIPTSFSPLNERREEIEPQTPPDFRLIANPFDPPSSVHLRQRLASFSIFDDHRPTKNENDEILSIERRAEINPKILSENFLQIDTSLFNEELQHRYQRASDHFCQTILDLPTPIQPNVTRTKTHSFSNSSSNSSLDRTRTTRHMACQTRLSLPPAADLDSLIQSFASTSDPEDLPASFPTNNTSLNASQIRRKLFSEDEDFLDEIPRRSSTFDIQRTVRQENQRSSSPSQHDQFNEDFHRQGKPMTPDCSPIPLKTTEFSPPNRQIPPSDYARQVLDKALAELLECSM